MLFDIQNKILVLQDSVQYATAMRVQYDHLKFRFTADNIVVGHMTVHVVSGKGRIIRLELDKSIRRTAHLLITQAGKLALASRVALVANTNLLIPKGTVEKRRRKMFTTFAKLFKASGFHFTSTYSLTYGTPRVVNTDLVILTKPLSKLTYADIKKPKHFWQSLSPEELDEYKERCFTVFRRDGFPHVSTSKSSREQWLRALMNTNIDLITAEGHVRQNLSGLSLAWSFHPHAWSVPCGKNFMTVLDAFNDDDRLRLLVKRLIDYYPVMSKSNLFGRIKMLSGVQAVSNFRPSAAAALYEHFGGGVIQDMSGGWGGRMLGAYRAPNVHRYIATEPSSLTHAGLTKQVEFLTSHRLFKQTQFEVHKLGSEVFKPDKSSIDFAFTSPPYFNCERYSDEKTQSYVKFNTYDAWADGFLRKTFENVRYGLKPGKFMAINIANVAGADQIESDTVRVAVESGFKHVDTMHLMLSAQRAGHKLEPIFIFKRV